MMHHIIVSRRMLAFALPVLFWVFPAFAQDYLSCANRAVSNGNSCLEQCRKIYQTDPDNYKVCARRCGAELEAKRKGCLARYGAPGTPASPHTARASVFIPAGQCAIAAAQPKPGYKFVWQGECIGGYAKGVGVLRMYESSGRLGVIGKFAANGTDLPDTIEIYAYSNTGKILRQTPFARAVVVEPSEVPAWARELVEPSPAAAVRPLAPSSTAPGSNRAAGVYFLEDYAGGKLSMYHPVVGNDESVVRRRTGPPRDWRYNGAGCRSGSGPYFAWGNSVSGAERGIKNATVVAYWACGAPQPEAAARRALERCRERGGCSLSGAINLYVADVRYSQGIDDGKILRCSLSGGKVFFSAGEGGHTEREVSPEQIRQEIGFYMSCNSLF